MDNYVDTYVDTYVGVLHLSSKNIYSTNKSGVIRKEFTPFVNFNKKMLVKTKLTDLSDDVCAVVKVENYDEKNDIIYCVVHEYIGTLGTNDNDIKMIKSLCTAHWTNKYNKQFADLKLIDLTPDRKDYTSYNIYSIDPPNCIDIDDALHIIKNDDGYEVGIHIADVSSYIKENTIFDVELSKRISSIYLNNLQINMIPDELSINHISLKEKSVKRAFSVIYKFNINYEIIHISFLKTYVNVKKNLSYDECTNMLDKNEDINNLYQVAKKIKEKFNFLLDDEYDVHQMVAIYMILTNKTVAEFIRCDYPEKVLLRSQQHKKIILKKESDIFNSKIIKLHNNSLHEKANYKIGIENSIHEGLGLEYYTHFTSPMRRYADILVHRQLYKCCNNIPVESPSEKQIFLMNYYSSHYKKIERYSKIFELITLFNDGMILNAFIVSIKDENSLRLYFHEIKDFDFCHDFTIINKKIKHLFNFKYEEDKIIINNKNNDVIELKLFQQIKVNVIITKKSMHKIHIDIIEPDFCLFIM